MFAVRAMQSDSRILLRLPSSIFSFISVQCNVMHDALSASVLSGRYQKIPARPLILHFLARASVRSPIFCISRFSRF